MSDKSKLIDDLKEACQFYHRQDAVETLRRLEKLGYKIIKKDKSND